MLIMLARLLKVKLYMYIHVFGETLACNTFHSKRACEHHSFYVANVVSELFPQL